MTRVEQAARWLEVVSERLNPILVKETRQALKSRQFVATFLLMLTASWLISIIGVMITLGQVQYGEAGEGFFIAYYAVLAVAILIIVPFGAFRSLINEKDLDTAELLQITTLSPRRIVWGKLMSAVVQLLIYYSAIAPFIAFTALLRGFDLATAGLILVLSFFFSIHSSMIALMLSTLVKQRHTQSLLSLMLLAGLAGSFFSALSMTGSAIAFEVPIDQFEFWTSLALVCVYGALTFLLFLQIATAQLTFESDNRSTGIRLTSSAIFAFTLLWVGATVYVTVAWPGSWFGGFVGISGMESLIIAVTTFSAFGLAAVGLFAVTEDEHLSRRVRRDLPRRRFFRLLRLPFLPGGGRGLIYLFGHTVLLWAFSFGILALLATKYERLAYVTSVCCYLLIYLGFGASLGRLIREAAADIRAAHARVLIVFLGLGGTLIPHLVLLFDSRYTYRGYSLFFLTDPFFTSASMLENNGSTLTIPLLGAVAVLAFAINVRTMLQSITEVMRANRPGEPVLAQHELLVASSQSGSEGESDVLATYVSQPESQSTPSAPVPQE